RPTSSRGAATRTEGRFRHAHEEPRQRGHHGQGDQGEDREKHRPSGVATTSRAAPFSMRARNPEKRKNQTRERPGLSPGNGTGPASDARRSRAPLRRSPPASRPEARSGPGAGGTASPATAARRPAARPSRPPP